MIRLLTMLMAIVAFLIVAMPVICKADSELSVSARINTKFTEDCKKIGGKFDYDNGECDITFIDCDITDEELVNLFKEWKRLQTS